MKVEFILDTGFVGATHKVVVDLPDDFREDDLEEYYQDWKNDLISGYYNILQEGGNAD